MNSAIIFFFEQACNIMGFAVWINVEYTTEIWGQTSNSAGPYSGRVAYMSDAYMRR